MKSNYSTKVIGAKKTIPMNENDIKRGVDAEWERRVDEVYKVATRDASAQLLAVFFTVLNKYHGFGKKRLINFKLEVENMFKVMDIGVCGKKFTTIDCIKYMKDNFNIDFDEEMKIKK